MEWIWEVQRDSGGGENMVEDGGRAEGERKEAAMTEGEIKKGRGGRKKVGEEIGRGAGGSCREGDGNKLDCRQN